MKPILLVEDNADDAFFARRAFKNAGIVNPVVVLEDGEAATKYLENAAGDERDAKLPGLVLLDLKLPLKSGLDVLQWIRSQKSAISSLVTVAMVSCLDSPDIEATAKLGANTFLVKPPTAEKLIKLRQNLSLSFLEIPVEIPQPQH